MWDKVPYKLSSGEIPVSQAKGRLLSYREAIREGFIQAMQEDPRVFLFGEGIDDPAGVFGTTVGLQKLFGASRVFDTPICENTLTGIAIGSSLAGLRPVLIHMRTDFLLMSMDQLANHAAKWNYMFGGAASVPMVVRAVIGGGWGSAAQHSQPLQAIFAHIPGLKVVMPASAYDAKGLLLASIAERTPVLFIDHRWLYDQKEPVPAAAYRIPLGKICIAKKGTQLSLICVSFMRKLGLEAAAVLAKEGVDIEVIDVRTIKPLDIEGINRSVARTGRALILDFGYSFCGIGAEIAARVSQDVFASLKAPVHRMGLPDVPTPASPVLESCYYPDLARVIKKIRQVLFLNKRKDKKR
jgi:pyruvate/2-oxoglutarate/acetoin dehydrogenase E1 component